MMRSASRSAHNGVPIRGVRLRAIGLNICAWLCIIAPVLAQANETSEGATPGVLRSSPSGSLSPRQAHIRIDEQMVAIAFTPAAVRPGRLQWIGKPFGWLGEAEPYPDRHFPELELRRNGALVHAEESVQVLAGAKDIASDLRTAGISPWAVAETPPFIEANLLPAAIREQLLDSGAITRSGPDYLANWQAQRSLSMALAPGDHVALTYKLRPSYALLAKQDLLAGTMQKRYCYSRAALAGLFATTPDSARFVANMYEIDVAVDRRVPKAVWLDFTPPEGALWASSCMQSPQPGALAPSIRHARVKPDARGRVRILVLAASQP